MLFLLFLSSINTKISAKEGSMGSYVAKTLFLQLDKDTGYTGVW